jgi:hexosaminidase
MKRLIITLFLITFVANATINIIPQPTSVKEQNGSLALSKKVKIANATQVPEFLLKTIDSIFKEEFTSSTMQEINVSIKISNQGKKESYHLNVNKGGIFIVAPDELGAFYALQSVKQLILFNNTNGTIPFVEITDSPRYGWRGFMLDESRHFFGKEKVKQLLDFMAMYKLNRFHWHLTDSEGWRIEIKAYPKLTTVGAKGDLTDKNAAAKFYTQKEIKELIRYAKERGIEILPEIDMPGHAGAATKAYPEVNGGGSKRLPGFTFNPGSEKTYQFLTGVIKEVSELFPYKWIHYGGDEVHFANKQWANIPGVQKLMNTQKLNNLKEVEHYFNNRMAHIFKKYDKKVAGWDEVVDAGLNKDETLVFWWRHNRKDILASAFKKDYKVVLCPRVPCYFDFVQDNSHRVGRRWNGFSSIERLYKFPKGLKIVENQVAGIQANLWTETVITDKRLHFMIYPRLQALAESAWTSPKNKNLTSFNTRLKPQLAYLKKKGIYYYNPFDQAEHPEPKK